MCSRSSWYIRQHSFSTTLLMSNPQILGGRRDTALGDDSCVYRNHSQSQPCHTAVVNSMNIGIVSGNAMLPLRKLKKVGWIFTKQPVHICSRCVRKRNATDSYWKIIGTKILWSLEHVPHEIVRSSAGLKQSGVLGTQQMVTLPGSAPLIWPRIHGLVPLLQGGSCMGHVYRAICGIGGEPATTGL